MPISRRRRRLIAREELADVLEPGFLVDEIGPVDAGLATTVQPSGGWLVDPGAVAVLRAMLDERHFECVLKLPPKATASKSFVTELAAAPPPIRDRPRGRSWQACEGSRTLGRQVRPPIRRPRAGAAGLPVNQLTRN
jgi:hypothetical protein